MRKNDDSDGIPIIKTKNIRRYFYELQPRNSKESI